MSSSTAIAFLVQGSAPFDYAAFLACATGVGAVFGKIVVGWVVKKFRRPSLIIFLLGGIILASVIIMAITGAIDVINDIRNGRNCFSVDCAVQPRTTSELLEDHAIGSCLYGHIYSSLS